MLDLSDRKDCFYWQTDRKLDPQDYKTIFLQRHDVPEEVLIKILQKGITVLPISDLVLIPADENVLKGNVNIVRKILIDGKQYVVRMHPKGVKNGYFYVEKTALFLAKKAHLPVPEVLEIHEATSEHDMDFMLMTVVPGITMDVFLGKDKSNGNEILLNAGKIMARIHDIRVNGFGPFDNALAKQEGRLVGLHDTNQAFIATALSENLQRLVALSVATQEQINEMKGIMESFHFEPVDGPRLVHNDFADWNLLTDGKTVTGILDWDECCGADPVLDLACWSTFFSIERFATFLDGYTTAAQLPDDFEERFHYYRLRYTISKMALRAKRFLVDQSDFVKERIEVGKKALEEELVWFSKR